MLLRDGELFVHLPGAAGLRIVDGELYGVLGKASRTIKELSGSCEAAATATGAAMRHSLSAGTATADTVAISAASRQRLAEGIAAIAAEGAGTGTRQCHRPEQHHRGRRGAHRSARLARARQQGRPMAQGSPLATGRLRGIQRQLLHRLQRLAGREQ